MIAYCWANGRIEFGTCTPPGAIPIARGNARLVRQEMGVFARHSYTKGVLLVPGVPEAPDQKAAGDALELFLLWLKQRERKGFRIAIKPRNPFDYDMCGQVVSSLSADDRCRAVADFDKAACMAALLMPNLQATVRIAINRRMRKMVITDKIAEKLLPTQEAAA